MIIFKKASARLLLAGLMMGLLLLGLGQVAAQDDAAAGQQAQDESGNTGESGEGQFFEEPTVTPEPTPLIVAPVEQIAPIPMTSPTGPWLAPTNLSRSGATSKLQMVADRSGRFHVLWRDAIDGFVYTEGNGLEWAQPSVLELPFATRRGFFDLDDRSATPLFDPMLVAGPDGTIHAFWLDTVSGTTPGLYHSQVQADSFATFEAWTVATRVDTAAAAPKAVVDPAGVVHVAYVRTREDVGGPAGVYYQRLDPAVGVWGGRAVLYQSRYMRGLEPGAGVISIAVRDGAMLGVAWSDPRREQLFVVQSPDSGVSWEAPIELDRRAPGDAADAVGPGNVVLGGLRGGWLVTYGAGHERGRACTQYSRRYSDVENSWSMPDPIDGLTQCLTNAVLLSDGEWLYLMGLPPSATAQNQTGGASPTMLAYDGTDWSLPQTQDALRGFTNPETNQTTQLGCQTAVMRGKRLSVVACDTGAGGDVWFTARDTGDAAAWFPPASVWSGPERIAGSEQQPLDLQLVADGLGATHAFWREERGSEIYHMRWDGQRWSSAFPVLTTGTGALESLTVAAFADRLYLVGRDNTGVFFSQALASRPSEWSAPRPLDPARPGAIAPAILADSSGVIVVYAMPLNEQRGVYLTRSATGEVWSEPRLIFDGTAADWEMVDRPQLAKTEGGELHLTMLRRGLPPEARPQSIAYSRSTSDAANWSEAISLLERPVGWTSLLAVGERIVHRLWIEETNGRAVVWHAQSIDDGLTWAQSSQVTGLDEGETPAVTVDPLGRVHLLALNGSRLLNWVWDGQVWSSDEGLTTALADGGAPAAAADSQGRLAVVYAGHLADVADPAAGRELFAMARTLAVPAEELPQPPTLTPTPLSTAAPESTPTPGPTPTLVLPVGQDAGPLSSIPGANSQVGQIALALLPALLVVVAVTAVGVRAVRMGRR